MDAHQPYEAETLLPPGSIADPARSSVANSLGAPLSSHGGEVRDSQYSSAPLNVPYDPYGETGTPSPRGTTLSQYRDDPSEKVAPTMVLLLIALVALAVVIIAVIVPVYFKVIKPNNNAAQSSGSSPVPSASAAVPTQSETPQVAITGGDGSQVTTNTGSTFIYNNSFGGFCTMIPRILSATRRRRRVGLPLESDMEVRNRPIRGVNLGGWLVLEPFITPALYEPYMNASTPTIDEWTLCENLANDPSSGGVAKAIEEHYKTFVTEEDFAQIAAAGLNWVRIPILTGLLKCTRRAVPRGGSMEVGSIGTAIEWARKYGLRLKLDLHTAPGSQNAYNHSGRMGRVGWLNGTMGIANAQRTLNHIRIFTQFISQPQYKDIVLIYGILNETPMGTIPRDPLERFHLEAYSMMRNITDWRRNGPWMSIHDGFDPLDRWADFLPGSDRVMLDTHPYYSFGDQDASPPANQNRKPCTSRARAFNESMATFGMTISGSLATLSMTADSTTDLTLEQDLALNGWTSGCGAQTRRRQSGNLHLPASMPTGKTITLLNYFFWTWKIGESTTWGNIVASPLWSYKHGLENGFMPKDPREAIGTCGNASPWDGPLPASKTGGAGAGTIPNSYATARTWPPPSLSGIPNAVTLPTYTATGTLISLKPASFTGAAGINGGNGWANSADQQGLYTPISGCPYPSSVWGDAVDATQTLCNGGSSRRSARGGMPYPKRLALLLDD
ncbi:Cellulase (glycosyl hydrolase family 5) [Rhizoctonia solani]|uniref:glucan 1,3-beta-glucosidase n=1 Tax=Rhizoctonia solani TaxID=456999 RepID=A0A8H7M0T0_9AGAM|nr:Cellulase (glycosyl hydrolase family 5) [Rhizoctonia solani]